MTQKFHRDCCRLTFSLAAPERLDPRIALNQALATSEERIVLETILQSIPYSGFPGAVEALSWLREDIPDKGPRDPHSPARDVFEEVYGVAQEKVTLQLRRGHPDLEKWIRGFAYETVMKSSPWETVYLEYLAISSLLGQSRMTPFHSHLRGALRCGATQTELAGILDHLKDVAQPESWEKAQNILKLETQDL